MKRLGFITAIILAGAAGPAISWWRSAAPSLDADVRSLHKEVAALRERPPIHQTVLSYAPTPEPTVQAEAAAAALAPSPQLAPSRESDEEKMARLEQRTQAMAESLDRRLLTEARDAAWANTSLAQAGEALTKVPGARVLSSTCASTVCRVEISQQTNDEQRGLGNSISSSPPFDQGTLYRYDYESVPPKTTLYVIRQGHELAELTGADVAAPQ